MDAHFQSVEQASRLKLSLNTEDGDHFDQVIAISQGMINHAIQRMHEQNEEMNDFYGETDSGSIAADLAPSELIIPVGDEVAQKNNIVIWRTNIKTGNLTVNYKKVAPIDYNIDGWSVDVKVPLTWEKFQDAPDDKPEDRQRKENQRQFIRDQFEVPGDYRPERLYAKMASGWWDDVKFSGASSEVDKSDDAYEAWKEVSNNKHASSTLKQIFQDLCSEREKNGMTTIGTRFNLDAAKISEHAATFAPTGMIHQGFPYRIGSDSGKTGWERGVRGTGDPGSRNCLLYCENVDRRPITWKQLLQTGNFATIGNPSYQGSRVDGSFVLSRQLVFEKFLLPKLQAFVKESQIYPGPANIEWDRKHTFGLELGANPSKDPNGDSKNPIYAFHAVPANGQVEYYEAFVESTYEPSLFEVQDSGFESRMAAQREIEKRNKEARRAAEQVLEQQRAIQRALDPWSLGRIGAVAGISHSSGGFVGDIVRGMGPGPVVIDDVDGMMVGGPGTIYVSPDHAKYWGEGSPRVTVKWQKGGNRITIRGETNYNVYITIADNDRVNSSHQLENASWREIVRWKFTWEMYIDVTVKDGSLELKITHDRDLVKVADNSEETDEEHHGTQSDLANNLNQELERLHHSLEEGFADTAKFFYPGNGQLTFKNAVFGEKGDLIAEIGYQDTPDQKKIIIPPPKRPDNPHHGGEDEPASKLDWTTSPVKSSTSPVEIRLTGKNATKSTVYLSKLEVKYSGFTLGTELFTAIKFVTANGKPDEVEISAQTESASPMSTPVLAPKKFTSKKWDCLATFTAATSPIAVQPGGSIHLIAKGATGKPGTKRNLGITQSWCDEAGKAQTDEDGKDKEDTAFVAVELSS